jgi:ABC-2 type transport system permease protein
MHNALLVAKREYLERIRSKAFRVSTVLIPAAFAAIFGLTSLSAKSTSGDHHLVVASNDADLAASVRTELTSAKHTQLFVAVMAPATTADLKALMAQVESKQIDGYLWLAVTPGQSQPEVTYVSRSSADYAGRDHLENAIDNALVREELVKRGMASDAVGGLLKGVKIATMQVKNGELIRGDSAKHFWGAYTMAFLIYFSVVFYGVNVAQSVVGEKTSRVYEVLLATARPESLMLGKLIGVGGAGLTQMGIWAAFALIYSGSTIAASMGTFGLASYGVTPLKLVFFATYFILGFLFYGALSAGFGATVSSAQEVQQFSMLIALPQIVGLVLMPFILGNPNSTAAIALSLLPPCTPIVMILRMAAMAVPWYQLLLSVVLMIAAILCLLWAASRIYRVGILMYGKRPTLPEMLRWMRYS